MLLAACGVLKKKKRKKKMGVAFLLSYISLSREQHRDRGLKGNVGMDRFKKRRVRRRLFMNEVKHEQTAAPRWLSSTKIYTSLVGVLPTLKERE